MKSIRVLVADDHPVVLKGVMGMLATAPDISLVGTATSGRQVLALTQARRPDVLLLDLRMPGDSPVKLLVALRRRCPQTKVLIFSGFCCADEVREVVAAGIDGYLLKLEAPQTMLKAIRTVAAGRRWFSQPVLDVLPLANEASSSPEDEPAPREMAVLELAALGKTNSQIALELGVSERTVRYYLEKLFKRLQAHNRASLVLRAIQQGWLDPKALE